MTEEKKETTRKSREREKDTYIFPISKITTYGCPQLKMRKSEEKS